MMPHAAVAAHGDGTHAAVAAHGDGTHAAVAAHPNALAEMRVTQPFTLNSVALKWIRDQNENPPGCPTTDCVDLTETDPIQIGVIVKGKGMAYSFKEGETTPWSWRQMLAGMNPLYSQSNAPRRSQTGKIFARSGFTSWIAKPFGSISTMWSGQCGNYLYVPNLVKGVPLVPDDSQGPM